MTAGDVVPWSDGAGRSNVRVSPEVLVSEQPISTDTRFGPRRLARWSWTALALTPVGLAAGLLVAIGLASAIGVDDLQNPGTMCTGEKAAVFIPTGVVWLIAPTLAVMLGLRAGRLGYRSGTVSALIAAPVWIIVLMLAINNPQG
jgi:hypothetical protein